MSARLRAAAVLALSLAVAGATACVNGRNDGLRDGAGLSSNGAGPAPQPGPLAGQNRDTTMAPAGAAPGASTQATSAGTAAGAVPTGTAAGGGRNVAPGQATTPPATPKP